MVKIRIPATTANLGCGFDCFGLALKLYLYLEIEETEEGLLIQSKGEDASKFENDDKNLIWKAFNLALKKSGKKRDLKGIKINTLNQIPATRGLGSSASAIIGGILAASELFNLKFSQSDILEVALFLEGHMDNIVPALVGGFALAYSSEKEPIKWEKIKLPDDLQVVVAIPDFSLSTEKMRNVLPKKLPLQDAVFNLSRSALFIKALKESDWTLLGEAMEDKVHQPYRMPFIPGIEAMFSRVKETGYAGIALSGSGPTVVSLTKTGKENTVSEMMKNAFLKAGIHCRVLILEPDLIGATGNLKFKC